MDIDKYLTRMKKLQDALIYYLDNENSNDNDFDELKEILNQENIIENAIIFEEFIRLLLEISYNHHRTHNFFQKIEQILILYEKEIKHYFSNYTMFTLFKKNKRILLFLIKQKFITVDFDISKAMTREKYLTSHYFLYFLPEIRQFLDDKLIEKVISLQYIEQILEKNQYLLKLIENKETNFEEDEIFDKKRMEGENDSYICTLIRNDSVSEFITYINQTNLSFSSQINPSIFETNRFLINKKTTLIEYASFYGSIQIFKYLMNNNVDLTESLFNSF